MSTSLTTSAHTSSTNPSLTQTDIDFYSQGLEYCSGCHANKEYQNLVAIEDREPEKRRREVILHSHCSRCGLISKTAVIIEKISPIQDTTYQFDISSRKVKAVRATINGLIRVENFDLNHCYYCGSSRDLRVILEGGKLLVYCDCCEGYYTVTNYSAMKAISVIDFPKREVVEDIRNIPND